MVTNSMKKALKRFAKIWEKNESNELSPVRDEFQFNYSGGYYIDLSSNNLLPKLHSAVWLGQIENVRKLLKKDDLNSVDACNRTALHLAVVQCSIDIVQLLLGNGANVEISDNDGLTPFLKAVEIGNIDIVQIFLTHDININITDKKGNTALHLAVLYGFCNIVALLLHKGVARNITNENGDTPLHIATQNEYLEVVDLLLKNGADFNIVDSKNKTPIMLAIRSKNIPLLKVFVYHGAHSSLPKDLIDTPLQEIIFARDDSSVKRNNDTGISNNSGIENSSTSDVENLVNDTNEDSGKDISMSKDGDSQISLQSCVIPPILKPIRSWNIIQSGMIQSTNRDTERNNMEYSKTSMDAKNNTTSGFSSYSINDENSDIIDGTCGRLDPLEETTSILEGNHVVGKYSSLVDNLDGDNNSFTMTNSNDANTKTKVILSSSHNNNNNNNYKNNNSFVSLTIDNKVDRSVTKEKTRAICKSLTTSAGVVTAQINLSDEVENKYADNSKDAMKPCSTSSRLRTYDKALKRLSLDAISVDNYSARFNLDEYVDGDTSGGNNAQSYGNDGSNVAMNRSTAENRRRKYSLQNGNNDDVLEDDNGIIMNRNDQTESALLSNIKTLKTEKSAHHQSLSKKRKRLFDMTTSTTTRNKSYAVTNENDSDDSSSDNDPPFWRNAVGHGGYFTKQSTVIKVNEDGNVELRDNANLRKIQNTLSSSSSDEDLVQTGLKNTLRHAVWDRLKEVANDKNELEDVTLSLRETTEKLKYDLENSRQIMTDKDDALTVLTKQLCRLDEKYIRTTEQMNEFRYCMKNLEQEVSHLTEVCSKANSSNQQLIQQVQSLIDNSNFSNGEKQKLMNQNIADIQKLQSDVLFWQEKHDVLMQKFENENTKDFVKKIDNDIKQVINEIQMLKERNMIVEASSKQGYTVIKRDNHKLDSNIQPAEMKVIENDNQISQITQEMISKSEEKLYTVLSEIKNILQLKFEQMHKEEVERNKAEARLIRDFENAKQKYVLEISRLASLLKSKEEEELKLKEQYNQLCNRIQSVKDEKRKHLITKSYSLGVIPTKNFSDGNVALHEQAQRVANI